MAANISILPCTLVDSDALTCNNIPAFWADPHWVLAWKHRTLEYHISHRSPCARRGTCSVIGRRDATRRPSMRTLVGLWVMPAGSYPSRVRGCKMGV